MTNPYLDAAAGMAVEGSRNRYAADAAELADTERSAVRSSVHSVAATAPDQAASAVRLGRQTGLPPDLVQRNLPAIQRHLAAERVDADTAAAPVLRQRFADPAFAALAHDDSAALARVEQATTGYTFGTALKKGAAGRQADLGLPRGRARKGGGRRSHRDTANHA